MQLRREKLNLLKSPIIFNIICNDPTCFESVYRAAINDIIRLLIYSNHQ